MTDPLTEPLDLATIRERIAAYIPGDGLADQAEWVAATALILHEPRAGAPEILFMERTERPEDRWSGQMALPGGRREPIDPDLDATARRETLEEVGVPLGAPMGRLDDLMGRSGTAVVATYVYEVDERPELRPDPREVASTVWIPVPHLLDAASVVDHRYMGMGPFPGVLFDRYTVWGLTLRTLQNFFEALAVPPPPWSA